jgi:HSP20 family protein
MFDEALRTFGTTERAWVPACNAWEDSNGFYVQMALPGWEPKDVTLEVNNQGFPSRVRRRRRAAVRVNT